MPLGRPPQRSPPSSSPPTDPLHPTRPRRIANRESARRVRAKRAELMDELQVGAEGGSDVWCVALGDAEELRRLGGTARCSIRPAACRASGSGARAACPRSRPRPCAPAPLPPDQGHPAGPAERAPAEPRGPGGEPAQRAGAAGGRGQGAGAGAVGWVAGRAGLPAGTQAGQLAKRRRAHSLARSLSIAPADVERIGGRHGRSQPAESGALPSPSPASPAPATRPRPPSPPPPTPPHPTPHPPRRQLGMLHEKLSDKASEAVILYNQIFQVGAGRGVGPSQPHGGQHAA